MILLIDQGNSRLKWACVDNGGQMSAWGAASNDDSVDSIFACIVSGSPKEILSVHGSSVAGIQRKELLADAVARWFSLPLNWSRTEVAFGDLRNGYDVPRQLGVDRWLALIGARACISGPALVVDAGTALTIDAVSSSGQHLGGYIVPGYATQCRSLGESTAAIRLANNAVPGLGFGRHTQHAVLNGVRQGLVAVIDRAFIELKAHVADTGIVVITGGDARLLVEGLSSPYVIDEDLLFRGLWETISPPGVRLHRSLTNV